MMNDKHILSSERGINSPQKNWFYLNLTLKVKRKKKTTTKERNPEVYLESTLHQAHFLKSKSISKRIQ